MKPIIQIPIGLTRAARATHIAAMLVKEAIRARPDLRRQMKALGMRTKSLRSVELLVGLTALEQLQGAAAIAIPKVQKRFEAERRVAKRAAR